MRNLKRLVGRVVEGVRCAFEDAREDRSLSVFMYGRPYDLRLKIDFWVCVVRNHWYLVECLVKGHEMKNYACGVPSYPGEEDIWCSRCGWGAV